MITQDKLKELLNYDPVTGVFTWKCRRSGIKPGQRAGSPCGSGHIQITINRRKYYAHLLAWLYMRGRWPEFQLDHRDLDPANNAFRNLREATNQQNQQNTRPKRGHARKGVYFQRGRWVASIRADGRRIHLGAFGTPDAASDAYASAAAKYHGEFARAA
jgi:hypothetical protein